MFRHLIILNIAFITAFIVILNGRAQDMHPIIRSGFENDTYLSVGGTSIHIRGTDHSVPGPSNAWDPLPDGMAFELWDQDTYPDKAYYELLPDPLNSDNRALMAELRGHNGVKGRAQGSFKFTYSTDYQVNIIHFNFRWLIPEDWRSLQEMDPHGWTDFFEIWCRYGDEGDFDVFDGAGIFRMNFSFEEYNGKFRWDIRGQDRCYHGDDDRSWIKYNEDIPVPFGEWAEFEVLVIKGPDPKTEPRSQARFLVKIKTTGNSWQTLFDVQDERTEHSYAPQEGYRSFQPVKNYTQANNIDYLISKGLRPVFYYDDFDLQVSPAVIPEAYRYVEVPGRIEAESFINGSGTALRNTTDTEGTKDVDSIHAGDWMEYQINTPAKGMYILTSRIRPAYSGAAFNVFSGDSLIGAVLYPASGDTVWKSLKDTIFLPAGNQTLKFVVAADNWKMNWFAIDQLPVPVVQATPATDTICGGGITGIRLHCSADMTYGAGFLYTSSASGTNISGNGSGNLTEGQRIDDTISITGDHYGYVNYTIVPYALSESGQPAYYGKPLDVRVWVEPVPELTTASMYDTIGSGDAVAILLLCSSDVLGDLAIGYTSETDDDINIEGNGSGMLLPRQRIIETLTNNGKSKGYVVYNIAPYIFGTNGLIRCAGTPVTDTVWVRPAQTFMKVQKTKFPSALFPNPARTMVFLPAESHYQVYSTTGNELVTGYGKKIDMRALHPGIYFVKTSSALYKLILE